jgi:hypothetical protein
MKYREAKPGINASATVKHYWELFYGRDEMSGAAEPIVPDGRVEIIFDFRDRFYTYLDDGSKSLQPRSMIAGQLS